MVPEMAEKEYPKGYLYKRIVQAKLFIEQHFPEPIDLDNIAGEASFSKFHFIRLFKNAYGQTPYQYLSHLRITKAKDLLKSGLPVNEVCLLVGFDSVSSFSGLFKRSTGSTPSAFQQQQLRRKAELEQKPLHFIPSCFAAAKGWI
jgi:AraC-like DNA-binding protein